MPPSNYLRKLLFGSDDPKLLDDRGRHPFGAARAGKIEQESRTGPELVRALDPLDALAVKRLDQNGIASAVPDGSASQNALPPGGVSYHESISVVEGANNDFIFRSQVVQVDAHLRVVRKTRPLSAVESHVGLHNFLPLSPMRGRVGRPESN